MKLHNVIEAAAVVAVAAVEGVEVDQPTTKQSNKGNLIQPVFECDKEKELHD